MVSGDFDRPDNVLTIARVAVRECAPFLPQSRMRTCAKMSFDRTICCAQLCSVLGIAQNKEVGQQRAQAAVAAESKKRRIESIAPTRREANDILLTLG